MQDEVRVTVIATGFEEAWLQNTTDVESRVCKVVNSGRAGSAFRVAPTASDPSQASGLSPVDPDIPTPFNNVG